MDAVQGLHHITAFAKDPQANVDFYHNVLGQRLVKRTVNFDDPGTYHLYYGDEVGTPGTIMTFFPWPHAIRGTKGNGEAVAVSYNIPTASLTYWQERLQAKGIQAGELQTRFGQTVLPFPDPDGIMIELVANDDHATIEHWDAGEVPAEHAIRGFHGVTLWVHDAKQTAVILTDSLRYTQTASEGNRTRFAGAGGDRGLYVDIVERPGQPRGRMGAGSIHHIAFRTRDDSEQLEYQSLLAEAGYGVTDVKDRQYFHSIYFREPNGVLFEIATDAPGFDYDEPVPELGQTLKLPNWLEPHRKRIEKALPELNLEGVVAYE